MCQDLVTDRGYEIIYGTKLYQFDKSSLELIEIR